MTSAQINALIEERLAAMTPVDHLVSSYEAYTRHGVHIDTDRDFYFKKAAVATAKYIGRPLTVSEITEAAERTSS